MSWEVNDRELESVNRETAKKRYGYFIKRVAAWEELWGIRSAEGWTLLGDDEGREAMAVWAHPRFVETFLDKDGDDDGVPTLLKLKEWLEWLPRMEKDGMAVAVMPTPEGKGVIVSAEDHRNHLLYEMDGLMDPETLAELVGASRQER